MKKFISTLLVGAMLACMAPLAGVFAADGAYEIANADDYLAFVSAVNGGTYSGGNNVVVTGALDMTGKTYTPITTVPAGMTIDFGGNAIENLNYEVAGADNAEIGMIAGAIGNGAEVKNLVLKNSSMTVTGETSANAAAIAGRMDRASVTNISTDNFTITSESTGYVALIGAFQHWCYQNYNVVLSGNLKDLTIDAPKATVGILTGWTEDWDGDNGMHVTVKNLTGNVTIEGAANVVTADTYIATNKLTAVDSESALTDGADQYYVDTKSIDLDFDNTTAAYRYRSIDTAKEFANFAADINAGKIVPTGTVKITKDLNMNGVSFEPIATLSFTLDFDGHTVSNLVVNTEGTDGNAGLIANKMANGTAILNASLSNCSLTTSAANVGIVVGLADRGSVPTAKLDKITVKADSAYLVGGVIGDKQWGCSNPDMSVEMNDVVIDANAASVIGTLVGRLGGDVQYGAGKINVKGVTATNVKVINANVDTTAIPYLGENTVAGSDTDPATNYVTEAEGAKIDKPATNDAVVGYVEPVEAPVVEPDTGDAMVWAVVVAVITLVGAAVISKKRSSAC